jgi:hypothetical protein
VVRGRARGAGFVGKVEVEEDGGDDGRIGQEREGAHLAATGGTEQRQHVVNASEQAWRALRAGPPLQGAARGRRP